MTRPIPCLCLALSFGCSPRPPTEEGPVDPGIVTTAPIPPSVPDDLPVTVALRANPDNPLSVLAEVTAQQDLTLRMVYGLDTLDRATPAVALKAGSPTEIVVLGLHEGRWSIAPEVDGVVGAPWVAQTFTPTALRAAVTEPMGSHDPDEVVCIAREAPYAYVCTDREGRPTSFVPLPDNPMFVRPLADGTLLAHPDGGDRLVRFDRAGRVVATVAFGELSGATYEHSRVDEHDVIEILKGPWAGAWAVLTVVRHDDVQGAGLVVFDPVTAEVWWDWSSGAGHDRLPLSRTTTTDDPRDWLHPNALLHDVHDGTDVFWMSLRHQDWVIRIDAPSGEVAWRLGLDGDFALVDDVTAAQPLPAPDDGWAYHQHAPELHRRDDGLLQMLLLDNGNTRPGTDEPYSRVVRYLIDEPARQASVDWSYGGPVGTPSHFFANAAGDIDQHPDGDRLLLVRKDDGGATLTELDWSGEARWSQRFPEEGEIYRAELYPSLYDTAWEARSPR